MRPAAVDARFVGSLGADTAACVAALANSGGGVAVVGVLPAPAGVDGIAFDPAMVGVAPQAVFESLMTRLQANYFPPFELTTGDSSDSGATPFFAMCGDPCFLVVVTGVPARGCVWDVVGLNKLRWRTGDRAIPMERSRVLEALERDVCIIPDLFTSDPAVTLLAAAVRLTDVTPRPEGQFHDNKAGVLFESSFNALDIVRRFVSAYAYLLMNTATNTKPATLTLGVYDGTFRPCPLLFTPSMTVEQAAAAIRAEVADAVRKTVLPPQLMESISVELTHVEVRPEDLVPAAAAATQPLLLQFDTFKKLRVAADRFLSSQEDAGGKLSCVVPLWTRAGLALAPAPLAFDDSTPMDELWFGVSLGASAASVQILRDAAKLPTPGAPAPDWSELHPALAFVVTVAFAASGDGSTFVHRDHLVASHYLRRGVGAPATRMDPLEMWLACRSREAWAAQVRSFVHGGRNLSLLVHGSDDSPVAAEMRLRLPLATWDVDNWKPAPAGDDHRAERLPNLCRLHLHHRSQALQVVVDASGVADVRPLVDDVLRLGTAGRQVLEVTLLAPQLPAAWDAVGELLKLWSTAGSGAPRVVFHLHSAAAALASLRALRRPPLADAAGDALTADLLPCARRFLEGDTAAFTGTALPLLRAARVDFERDSESAILANVSSALTMARPRAPRVVHVGRRWFGSGATTTSWRCMHAAAVAAEAAAAAAADDAPTRVAVRGASNSTFDAVRDAVTVALDEDAAADAGAAATPHRLAVLVLVPSVVPLTTHTPAMRAAREASVRVVVVNVSASEVTPAAHNLDARLTLTEMRRGLASYKRVFAECETSLAQLADELGLAPGGATSSLAPVPPAAAGGSGAVGAAVAAPLVVADATAASCSLLSLGLAARQGSYIPIQRVLGELVPARGSAGAHAAATAVAMAPPVARLVLTVATMELCAPRAADPRGVSNPLSDAVAAGARDADPYVLLLLQQQVHRAYPVTLHPAFAPLLLERAVACRAPPVDLLLSGGPHDRLVVVLADVVNHLLGLRAFDAADDLVLHPAPGSGDRDRSSPLVQGLLDADPTAAAAVDFLCLLLQPGYLNPLLQLPHVQAYYVLLTKLARTASVHAAQRASARGADTAQHSAAALQLAMLGVAAADRAWQGVRPDDWPPSADDVDLRPVTGRHSYVGGGISTVDGAAAAAAAAACVDTHRAVLASTLAAVAAWEATGPPPDLAAAAGMLHQLVTMRMLAARQAYEYGRTRALPATWLDHVPRMSCAVFDAGLHTLELLQWLHRSFDNAEGQAVDITSAAHVFQLLQSVAHRGVDMRWHAADRARVKLQQECVRAHYTYFAAAAARSTARGTLRWSEFDAFVSGTKVLGETSTSVTPPVATAHATAGAHAVAGARAGPAPPLAARPSPTGARPLSYARALTSLPACPPTGAAAGGAGGGSSSPAPPPSPRRSDADAEVDSRAPDPATLPLLSKLLLRILGTSAAHI